MTYIRKQPGTTSRKRPRPIVIKVGGSLLQLKELRSELQKLLDSLARHQVVLVTGGGPAVKALRHLNALSEEIAHWHCIKLMGDLTRTLSETFPNSVAVYSWPEVEAAWEADRYPWFIVEPFLRADDKNADHLPHSWAVSSDSIAAQLAARHQAELLLVKACALPRRPVTATTLARRGVVDTYFPKVVEKLTHWQVTNLPGGTLPEIALDLFAPAPVAPPRRRQHRGQQ
ncbi:MAG TPA: hypothetical protein PKD72_09360 [Gemmatales bacterium]|nr:hypothetical protein [Gemmatales bacterium]